MQALTLDIARTVLLAGFSAWLSLAVYNNMRDRKTNETLLGTMMQMSLLKEDGVLGQGLLNRARDNPKRAARWLTLIIVVEILLSAALWLATVLFLAAMFGTVGRDIALAVSNLALTAFLALWFFFMSGGLWFGYWIKTSHVQQVHMTLVLMSMALLILLNI